MPDELAWGRGLYLDLMERVLRNSIYEDEGRLPIVGTFEHDHEKREEGRDWPSCAHTMIGARRLRHLRECVERVLKEGVPGDLIEAGVWRGGATIMMRAVLQAYDVWDRIVWVADSFSGLPSPNPERYPQDTGLDLSGYRELAIPVDVVKANFRKYDLLDDRVRFVEGLFAQTLSGIPASTFAIIRLDGDLYESTMDTLNALYPKLAPGGYAIVDDYGAVDACRAAVNDYRERHHIYEEIVEIDWAGAYWRKKR